MFIFNDVGLRVQILLVANEFWADNYPWYIWSKWYENVDILHNMNRIAKIGMDYPQK